MFRALKEWLIPSKENDYAPHLLRAWPVAALLVLIVMFFGVSQMLEHSLTNVRSNLAAVVSSVLVDLTNFDRADEGLHGLTVNPLLQQAAQLKANDMAAKGYFAHNSPDGKSPWYWFGEAGYTFSYAGENLAVFFGDSEDVERAWMNSPGHRANILNSNFSEIGIATAEGYYQGQKTVFVVQEFGTPSVQAPIATLEAQVVSPSEEAPATGEVGGQSIQVIGETDIEPLAEPAPEMKIIQQDDTFIAVRDDTKVSAPSVGSPEMQSNVWQRLVTSPQTTFAYVYEIIAVIIIVALVLLIFLEMHIQRPKNIVLGVLILLVIGAIFYFSYTGALVATADGALRAVHVIS